MATLAGLPFEVLESIAMIVAEDDVRAAVSLTLANSEFYHKFGDGGDAKLFWRKLCQVLGIEVLKSENGSWKSAFLTFLAEEKSWKTCTRVGYDVFGKTKNLEPEFIAGEEVDEKGEKMKILAQKYGSHTRKAVRTQIRKSTYASTCDDKYLVLCHSEQTTHLTTITAWEIASGRQIHEGTVDFELASQDIIVWMGHFVCMPLWPGRHTLMEGECELGDDPGALEARAHGDPIVRGYDLSLDSQDFKDPSWNVNLEPEIPQPNIMQRPIQPQRYYPKRYKEGGGMRILKHEDYLVLVLPLKFEDHENHHGQWIIYLWKATVNETRQLTGIHKVDEHCAGHYNPFVQVQYASHDQNGANFVFCFYSEGPNGIYPFRAREPVGSNLVTMHLSKTNAIKQDHISSCAELRFCRHKMHLLVEIIHMSPFGKYRRPRDRFDFLALMVGDSGEALYNLRGSVEAIRMYTAAVGSRTRKMSPTNNFVQETSGWGRGKDRTEKMIELRSPAVYVIQANGAIGSFIGYEIGHEIGDKNLDRKTIPWRYRNNPLMSAGKRYRQDDWYFNEIISCDVDNTHKMIIMQKFADGMSLFAIADDENLSHLWTIALNETSINLDNRLYLKQCLGSVTVADCSGVHLFSSGSGKSLGKIKFRSVNRALPDVDPEDADQSFYAQTGLGIWDINSVAGGEAGGNGALLVIHDLERCAPVFFDAYQF